MGLHPCAAFLCVAVDATLTGNPCWVLVGTNCCSPRVWVKLACAFSWIKSNRHSLWHPESPDSEVTSRGALWTSSHMQILFCTCFLCIRINKVVAESKLNGVSSFLQFPLAPLWLRGLPFESVSRLEHDWSSLSGCTSSFSFSQNTKRDSDKLAHSCYCFGTTEIRNMLPNSIWHGLICKECSDSAPIAIRKNLPSFLQLISAKMTLTERHTRSQSLFGGMAATQIVHATSRVLLTAGKHFLHWESFIIISWYFHHHSLPSLGRLSLN